ncbi:hypothetical protein ACFL0L_05475 [Patescibacteria group bacterium]
MKWVNFLHIYQPPGQRRDIVEKVTRESYQPLLAFLKKNPRVSITFNISGSLTEQLLQYGYKDVIADLKLLAERGQVELVGSAKYHIILPLLPEETQHQIELNNIVNSSAFGDAFHPQGFFPPEMCYSEKMERQVFEAGYTWILLDGISYDGHLGSVRFDKKYQSPSGLTVVFRNRILSNFLSFTASADNPDDFWSAINKDERSQEYLITAMDGENLGHHRPELLGLWQKLVTDSRVETMTISAYMSSLSNIVKCRPVPSSWSSQEHEIEQGIPYGLWQYPDNEIHTMQWRLVIMIIAEVNRAKKKKLSAYKEVRGRLDAALSSDQFWWASAAPWWDVGMVSEGAKRLADVIFPLPSKDSVQTQAIQLAKDIHTTAKKWHETGIAKKRQDRFAKISELRPYIGGDKVINT